MEGLDVSFGGHARSDALPSTRQTSKITRGPVDGITSILGIGICMANRVHPTAVRSADAVQVDVLEGLMRFLDVSPMPN